MKRIITFLLAAPALTVATPAAAGPIAAGVATVLTTAFGVSAGVAAVAGSAIVTPAIGGFGMVRRGR